MKRTRTILEALARGDMSVDQAERELRHRQLEKVADVAVIDTGRQERKGIPEVVLADTKADEDLLDITRRMTHASGFALLTRVRKNQAEMLKQELKTCHIRLTGRGDHLTLLIHTEQWVAPEKAGRIAVITAGTSDIPYASEVEAMAEVMGVDSISFNDVGVSGIHRLVEPLKRIRNENVDAIVVLAGMEGALPTVVASLVDIPVIGVPVPTGYGYGGKGETALASMLQSCVPGLTVVNIGNGVGAGAFACLVARRCSATTRKAQP